MPSYNFKASHRYNILTRGLAHNYIVLLSKYSGTKNMSAYFVLRCIQLSTSVTVITTILQLGTIFFKK